jgi:SAM-dependent methyltransferase
MRLSLLELLCCPACGQSLGLNEPSESNGDVIMAALVCKNCQRQFPVVNSIPRFVKADAYTEAFSLEWNLHRTTQLDSASGGDDSERRLRATLNQPLNQLRGKRVLDVGCGAGRFAEVVLKYGGEVVGVDMSLAVEAAQRNLGGNPAMHVVQADLFHLPLRPGAFDLIYSLGVLHHTPDCRAAFAQLPKYLTKGGRLVVTVYAAGNKVYMAATTFWRRFTTRLPKRFLYRVLNIAGPLYYVYRIPGLYHVAMAIFPINMDRRWRWRILDTFDCYAPRYQSYHSYPEVFRWFEEEGLSDIRINEPGVTVAGRR